MKTCFLSVTISVTFLTGSCPAHLDFNTIFLLHGFSRIIKQYNFKIRTCHLRIYFLLFLDGMSK